MHSDPHPSLPAPTQAAVLASLLDWWQLAGADSLVGDTVRDWRAPIVTAASPAKASRAYETPTRIASDAGAHPVTPPVAARPRPPSTAPLALTPPDDLEAFRVWWSNTEALPLAPPRVRRAPIAGPSDARIMLLCDQPEDVGEDGLAPIAGDAAQLLEKMMAAVGLSLDALLCAPLLPVPSPTLRAGPEIAALAALHRQLLRCAKPDRLLVLGDLASRALLGQGLAEARGRVHQVEGVPTVVTFHPRHLLLRPSDKALAWADLLRWQAVSA